MDRLGSHIRILMVVVVVVEANFVPMYINDGGSGGG